MPLTTYRKQGRGGQGVIGSEANVAEAAAMAANRSAQTAREKKIEEVLTPAR